MKTIPVGWIPVVSTSVSPVFGWFWCRKLFSLFLFYLVKYVFGHGVGISNETMLQKSVWHAMYIVYLMLLVILCLVSSQMHFILFYFGSVFISNEFNLVAMVLDDGGSQSDPVWTGSIFFWIRHGMLFNISNVTHSFFFGSLFCLIKYAISYFCNSQTNQLQLRMTTFDLNWFSIRLFLWFLDWKVKEGKRMWFELLLICRTEVHCSTFCCK